MHTWLGKSLKELKRHSFVRGGITLMGLEPLIESKRHLGRRKDFADIDLLRDYLEHHTIVSEAIETDAKNP